MWTSTAMHFPRFDEILYQEYDASLHC